MKIILPTILCSHDGNIQFYSKGELKKRSSTILWISDKELKITNLKSYPLQIEEMKHRIKNAR